jgi:DNA-binding PucR family transcriptional regulator
MDRRFLPLEELRAFVERVRRLQEEGLTVTTIAIRLGVHRNTLNQRLRRFSGVSGKVERHP